MEDAGAMTATATNWAIFGATCAGLGYYYWSTQQRRPAKSREDAQHTAPLRQRRSELELRGRQGSQVENGRGIDSGRAASNHVQIAATQSGGEGSRKRKAQPKQPTETLVAPTLVVHSDEPEEEDANTREWAKRMEQARKGNDLTTTKNKEQRVKTVKQSSALNTPVLSSGSSAEADDDLSPAISPSLQAGDVEDMLEPARSGPSTLRLTAPSQPQKAKVARQQKQEDVETKKQRQNRKKIEERRYQREMEEKERKALEERQRRAAREARGEPARNGIPISKPPPSSAWTQPTTSRSAEVTNPLPVNDSMNAPLLDTFDADSVSSSNGGMEASTGPTSTSSSTARWDDMMTEDEQMAQAVKQSEDESGWTTVAQPKKSKTKATNGDAVNAVSVSNKTNQSKPQATVNGKPKGFQALEVEYEQRTDADPNDASNWDA